jgi:hypothetical protein
VHQQKYAQYQILRIEKNNTEKNLRTDDLEETLEKFLSEFLIVSFDIGK